MNLDSLRELNPKNIFRARFASLKYSLEGGERRGPYKSFNNSFLNYWDILHSYK